jgi:hypothetical protein
MKYKIVEVPLIYYEVQDENGEIYHDDEGDNLLDTIKEAEKLINILENSDSALVRSRRD